MSAINPLTAIGHLELAKEGGHKAVVITAAASSLGQMINRLFSAEGIQVVNVVRREAQVELLKRQGATIALNSSDADFDQQLHDSCHQHDVRLALDAVAGPMTTRLLKAMPNGSRVTIYGALSQQGVQANPDIFIFEDKTINGFWLGPWIMKKRILEIQRLWRRAQKLMASELKSNIRAEYPFEQARQAVEEYLDQMTGGKILLRPDHYQQPVMNRQ
jgi:NADPH:quinone reductase-like Zn-dependent oxidoreductase